MASYKLMWDDFCAWYLEIIKPEFIDGQSAPIDAVTFQQTIRYFERLLKVLHPFMPFITEEIWHTINERKSGDDIIISLWPEVIPQNSKMLQSFELAQALITELRNYRQQKNISPKVALQLMVKINNGTTAPLGEFESTICKLGNLTSLTLFSGEKPGNSTAFLVGMLECFIPFNDAIDINAERERLEKELEYARGFLNSVLVKLENKKFMSNAKAEIVASETKKKNDAELKIKSIEAALSSL